MRTRSVTVPKILSEKAAKWARKNAVSHALQSDGSLKLWYVTPRLRESLAEDIGPISVAEETSRRRETK